MSPDVGVAIIGGGLSGLIAARRLVASGADVVVLEARDRVGGRTLSARVGGADVDLGAQWVSPAHRRVLSLADELGVDTVAQYRDGSAVLVRDADTVERGLARVSLFRHIELGRRVRDLDAMSETVPVDDPAGAGRAVEWTAMSVADWLATAVKSAEVRETLALMIALDLGADPGELSMLYYLWSLAMTGGLRRRDEFRESHGELRLVGGAQRLSIGLAERLDSRVRTSWPVTRVAAAGDRVSIESDCGALTAGRVIVALPPPLWSSLGIDRAPPAMSMAPVVKCAVAYGRAWWRDDGLSGEAYAPAGPLTAVVDNCSADGRAALMGFATGAGARALGAVDAPARREAAIGALVEMFGSRAATPTDYADMVWSHEPWSGGCEAIIGPTGSMSAVIAMRETAGRVAFAGTETARAWPRYLEGAIEAGERAADQILERAAH